MAITTFTGQDIKSLLHQLTTGMEKPLFSVADWSFEFDPLSTGGSWFLEQMKREWLPISVMPNPYCAAMMSFVREYLAGKSTAWPHLWAHTLRVTGVAVALAPEANVDVEHAFLMGIFHDIGKLDEMQGGGRHEQIGANIMHDKLSRHLSPSTMELVSNVVAKKARSTHPYTRLLHDADKLDKIGATGIARRLSTDFGGRHQLLALRRVRADLERFPEMNFPLSVELCAAKKDFTRDFLLAVSARN